MIETDGFGYPQINRPYYDLRKNLFREHLSNVAARHKQGAASDAKRNEKAREILSRREEKSVDRA
jgi:hypothetical protein